MNQINRPQKLLLLLLLFPGTCYGYIDLGTGSYFFQLAIGFFVGSVFAIKMFWKRITDFFAKHFSHGKTQKEDTRDVS